MSSMKPTGPIFDSVDSVLNFLREPTLPEVVSSTTPSTVSSSRMINYEMKSTKKIKKEKKLANVMISAANLRPCKEEPVEILPTGRVRYGPITVNPRKQPSKTLFTGRRSKNEVLIGDEEEKRRLRRERNRVAATKCREKRENVLDDLEIKYQDELNGYTQLSKMVQDLQQHKQYLESVLSNHVVDCPLLINRTPPSQQTSMVFGNTGFLSSIMETPAPLLPPHQLQNIQNEEEEFSGFLQPTSSLINSTYNPENSNNIFFSEQQTVSMNSSSLERLISGLKSPIPLIDSNNNTINNCSGLYNSAYGSSSCARQHSSSSEDDSLPPARSNCIY